MEQKERKKQKKANKRQRDQMEFIFLAFLETRGEDIQKQLSSLPRQRDNFSLVANACSSTCSGSFISFCSLFMTSWLRQRGQKFLHLGSFLCNFHVIIFQLPPITVLCMCSVKVVYCGSKTSTLFSFFFSFFEGIRHNVFFLLSLQSNQETENVGKLFVFPCLGILFIHTYTNGFMSDWCHDSAIAANFRKKLINILDVRFPSP